MAKQKTSSEEQLERVHAEASRLLDLVCNTEYQYLRYWDDDTKKRFDDLYYSLKRFQGEN
jgi:hypothetical protein